MLRPKIVGGTCLWYHLDLLSSASRPKRISVFSIIHSRLERGASSGRFMRPGIDWSESMKPSAVEAYLLSRESLVSGVFLYVSTGLPVWTTYLQSRTCPMEQCCLNSWCTLQTCYQKIRLMSVHIKSCGGRRKPGLMHLQRNSVRGKSQTQAPKAQRFFA